MGQDAPAPNRLPDKLPAMVGWYDPLQLLATARQTVLADLFGGRADFRLHQQGRGGDQPLDYRAAADAQGVFWIDYVADMGDGFDATFSVAQALAQPSLNVRNVHASADRPISLPRGQVLLMGGDQVYPTPDDDTYLRRLVDPYELALPLGPSVAPTGAAPVPPGPPHLLAIPGNHDWYDGLQSFVKVFCRRSRVGGWMTPQSRSYFAVRLPHQFWLLGLDTQLHGDLDEIQLAYFVAQPVAKGDQVLIALPEPQWLRVNTYDCSARLPNNIVRLLDHLHARGAQVPLQLAGDTHHYRRHSWPPATPAALTSAPLHLITSGGGGAFLHPTHTRPRAMRCCYQGQFSLRRLRCKLSFCRASDQKQRCLGVRFGRPLDAGQAAPLYPMEREYPSAGQSWALALGNFAFLMRNPRFGLATAALYLSLAWLMPPPRLTAAEASASLTGSVASISLRGISDLTASPSRLLLFILVLFAFWSFTDTHRPLYRVMAASAHGGAHLLAALLVTLAAQEQLSWVAPRLTALHLPVPLVTMGQRLAEWAGVAAGGYLTGSILMGLYLLISCALFGRHSNEAFSALKIPDHKHFLRMRLHAGGLTVFVLAMDRVSRFRLRDGRLVQTLKGSEPVIIDQFEVPAPAGSGAPG